MKTLTSFFGLMIASAAFAQVAPSTERNVSPQDLNPACRERNVDANSPGCLAEDATRAPAPRVVAPPGTQPAQPTAAEFQPAPGLKPAPTLPPVGQTPLTKPNPTLPPVGGTPLVKPAPNLPAAGSQSPPLVTTPAPQTPSQVPTPAPSPAASGTLSGGAGTAAPSGGAARGSGTVGGGGAR